MPSDSVENKHPNLRRLKNTPVCIICARSNEAEQIAKALGYKEKISGYQVSQINNGHTFFLGSFTLQNGDELGYYVTHSTRQSVQSFLVEASILLFLLKPKHVLHAGTCAGYRGEEFQPKLGDVILAESAFNYEEGKYLVDDKGNVTFRGDFDKVTVSAGDMQSFAESPERPQYHFGDIMTGSSVRTDAAALFSKIRLTCRNVIGLDMEASAFLKLCQSEYFNQIHCCGVVKGISDFGDSKKKNANKDVYEETPKNTAAAIKDWVTDHIREVTWEPPYGEEPAADLVPGYYDNFVEWVMQFVDFGGILTGDRDASFQVPASAILGFKIVMPPQGDPDAWTKSVVIQDVTKNYNLKNVKVNSGHATRYLFYKAGFLIDFPRTISDLAKYEDKLYQTEVFGTLLRKKPLLASRVTGIPPRVAVCGWQEFKGFLDQAVLDETSQSQPVGVVTDATNGVQKNGVVGPWSNRSRTEGLHQNGIDRTFPSARENGIVDTNTKPSYQKTMRPAEKEKKRGSSRSPRRMTSVLAFFGKKSNSDLSEEGNHIR